MFCKLLMGSDPMIKQKQIVLDISKFINKLSHKIIFLNNKLIKLFIIHSILKKYLVLEDS